MTKLSELTPAARGRAMAREGLTFGVGPFNVRVRTPLKELQEAVGALYADQSVRSRETIVDFDLEVRRGPWAFPWRPRRCRLLIDGKPAFRPFPRGEALAALEWGLNWCLFTRPHTYLILHAAVLAKRDDAVLLSGAPGAGKSTLAAAMMFSGWRLFSDEVGLLDPDTGLVHPVPRPVSLKNESIDLVRRRWAAAVIGPAAHGTRKGRVAHVAPTPESVRLGHLPARPGLVVFVHFHPEGPAAELAPVGRGEAMLRLAKESFNYTVWGEEGFLALGRLLEGASCRELRYHDLDQALRLLSEAQGAAAPGHSVKALHGGSDGGP